ncbi:MAG: DNA polymerase/3'-5' exonuclease PolX [Patescibacteria group bacterium]
MDNIEIAQIFNQVADILEIRGANQFRVGAYRRAAQVIEALPKDINEIYRENKLEEMPGVGESIASHIKELIKTGKCKEFENLKKKVPAGLIELMRIEGLGPKRVKFLYKKFGIKNIQQLEKLLVSHRLLKEKGWGEKSEQNILRGIELYHRFSKRFLLGKIYFLAQGIVDKLKKCPEINQVELCGSIRRMKETIGDLDILATARNPKKAIDFFCQLPEIQEVRAKGPTKVNVLLRRGPEADLRVVKPESFGAALHYFTGSKSHNIAIRRIGVEKGLRINEYGVYKKIDGKLKLIGGRIEEEVFKAVDLPWIPPEIRENTGEIEAAFKNQLPKLITLKDIQGDLHSHSNWSDGAQSILEMAEAAKNLGYKYIAITDHTPTVGITHGLTAERVLKQIKEIQSLNKKLRGIRVLAGIEVDIRKDGSLDLPDKILEKLDIVVASVHTAFRQSREEMTKRIIKAIRNPNVDIIGHPTGRLINEREPYELDLEAIMTEAKRTGTILELNSFWNRLDLSDVNCRLAKERGVKIAISTDAHNAAELEIIKFGVATARRGWLEKKDAVNTLPLDKLLKLLKSPK